MKEQNKNEKAGGTGFPACAEKDGLLITRRNLPHWQFPAVCILSLPDLNQGSFLKMKEESY
jgi:hypothetical protein